MYDDQIVIILRSIDDRLAKLTNIENAQIKKDEYRGGVKVFYHKIGCDGDSILTKMGFSEKFIIYCPKCNKKEILE